jgi:hypothetical protein
MTTIIRFPDPLHALLLRWRAIGETVADYPLGAAPPALLAEWREIERRMIGLRPTTPEGAEAAVAFLTDWIACHCDDPLPAALAAALSEAS